MPFSIDMIVDQVAAQFGQSPLKSTIENTLKASLNQKQGEFEALQTALQNGELTQEEFQIEIEREKALLTAEMETLKIIAKAEVQKIVNQVFQAITSQLK
ncbi:hypothetical protein [Vibrio gazogenes]|uniref:Uncharacterized protein n=1 Tax=Vibrio gazogenes DSM 21264 = NBRC 103151 TaxID=1123492 RepID=A0A1M5HHX7_VIBGA|nr:hypothetical protein [Vibrio gazogenes]USP13264.1 hypothetical protein MKS89_12715 [Vibrio gazogenes]SHG15498.1 hypothetical protein SAMN02745781_04102 [Vibrio gazogenes DSM 21264] [Vibrio gazogenes DSM 21264 = NBRC 103151]SJN56715.1 hypothetical protein BQ6471_02173 [Vibrio gazogenes]